MILPSPLDRAVLDGRKTQHRLPIKPGKISGTVARCPHDPGSLIGVQRWRGGPEIARVEVVGIVRSVLGAVTFKDARAEGYPTRAQFADAWMRRNDRSWPPAIACPDCYEFRAAGSWDDDVDVCTPCEQTGSIDQDVIDLGEDVVLERFHARYATAPVWVLAIRLAEQPRMLAAGGNAGIRYRKLPPASGKKAGRVEALDVPDGRDADRGYTTSNHTALPGEPEAVDAATLAAFTKEAGVRSALQRSFLNQQLVDEADSLHERITRLQEIARRRGVDVRADVRVIEARLRRIQADLGRGRQAS